ncbi:MAG: hypothetical protein OIF38_04600, partial [Cellvibrionaceae bacterium]|nr:hypothetical protein [Cellvibrionaceae bacterium]
IQELQRRLQSVVRQTDIFTELEDDKALLLLTHCSPKWAERISEKIRSIESSNSSSLLKLNIRSYALPDKKLPDDTQQWLLDNAGQTEFANVG